MTDLMTLTEIRAERAEQAPGSSLGFDHPAVSHCAGLQVRLLGRQQGGLLGTRVTRCTPLELPFVSLVNLAGQSCLPASRVPCPLRILGCVQAGLAKLIGLAGETNVQASSRPFCPSIRLAKVRVCCICRRVLLIHSSQLIHILQGMHDVTVPCRARSKRSWTCSRTKCLSRP